MVIKNLIRRHKKDSTDFIEPDTLTERLRRARAMNARPSDIGITKYSPKSFSVTRYSGCMRYKI